jgi:hypothetical protein
VNTREYTSGMTLGHKVAKALAIALMFWCAGAGCMMVSYAHSAMRDMDTATSADAPAMAHMSGSMDAHACCKARRRGAKRSDSAAQPNPSEITQWAIPAPVQTSAMSCCPLTSGSIVVASRSTSNDEALALSQTDSSAIKPIVSYQKPLAIPLRLPNRAQSYLLDCAFLI